MKILKFGGTSVGSAERMKAVAKLVLDGEQKIVVLSAMSGTTNTLVEIAEALYANKNDKARVLIDDLEQKYHSTVLELFADESYQQKANEMVKSHFDYLRSFTIDSFTSNEEKAVLAQGELISTAFFHFYLQEQGCSSELLPALEFMRIDQNEEPDFAYIDEHINKILKAIGKDTEVLITQGYICRNSFGEIDNLKRGGSDYTATLLGAATGADEIQIWTDIDGMHNNDPRVVDNTFPVTELSFDEAAELAYFGAKILHPTCVLPAKNKKVPVRLLNTMQPQAKGTLISDKESGPVIKAIAAKDGITALKIKSDRMLLAYGFLRSVFEVFERYKTPIDMITTSEVAVSVTIDKDEYLDDICKDLTRYAQVEVDKDQSIVCIVGNLSAGKEGYASKIFEALKSIPVRMISYGGSEHNVSILVDAKDKKNALLALNEGLFD